mgnify:CR=1 FL=1
MASADINVGEDALAVPYTEWITLQIVAKESALCKKLCDDSDIQSKLSEPWANKILAVFIIEQL